MGIYDYIILFNSIFVSGILSFIISGLFVKRLTPEEITELEKKENEMIEYMNILNFEFLYTEEYEELEDMELKEEDIEKLKDIRMSFDVPNNKLILFYKDGIFYYYTEKGDIIYKYLNVACRKYVIDNNCKRIFKQGSTMNEEKKNEYTQHNYFIKKKIVHEKKTEEKDKIINKTIWLGTINEQHVKQEERIKKDITFLEFSSRN